MEAELRTILDFFSDSDKDESSTGHEAICNNLEKWFHHKFPSTNWLAQVQVSTVMAMPQWEELSIKNNCAANQEGIH